ncbi:MAG: primase [Bacilli bacterium]|nr:primase [Bacilli bacterium]
MTRISEEVVDQVRGHFDIVDVISEYVQLKRSGRTYMGLCPFHSEKSPSFSVSRDKQFFHCFGCGEGGDILSFVMKAEGLTFVETLEQLASRAGIALPDRSVSDEESEENRERRQMLAMYELAGKFYHHLLLNHQAGREARAYLTGRGIEHATMDLFQLGFSPGQGDVLVSFLERRGFKGDAIERAGLGTNRKGRMFDKFRGRVMFPIQDGQGRIIAFGGRIMGAGEPKYLNSPETLLYQKGRNLYNLHRARPQIRGSGQAILCEGYLDVIVAYQSGISNVVAALGTALTPDQARVLGRNAEELILLYDGDQAGQRAALRSIEVIRESGGRCKIVVLPDKLDPDEFIRSRGVEAFKRMTSSAAVSDTRFKIQKIREESQLSSPEGQARFLQLAVQEISQLSSVIEQETYLKELAGEFNVTLESLKSEVTVPVQARGKADAKLDKVAKMWNTSKNHLLADYNRTAKAASDPVLHHERRLLTSMLLDSGAAKQVLEQAGDQFSLDEHAALAAYLYQFYAEHAEENPALFLTHLSDPKLRSLASSLLAVSDNQAVRADLLQESMTYLLHRRPMQDRKRELPALLQEAHNAGDIKRFHALQEELIDLNKNA